eukprot:6243737-Prymnesium_polylepis.1
MSSARLAAARPASISCAPLARLTWYSSYISRTASTSALPLLKAPASSRRATLAAFCGRGALSTALRAAPSS